MTTEARDTTVRGRGRVRAPRVSLGRLLPFVAVAAVALALPALLDVARVATSYVLYLISLALIYGIVAIGLNILIGNTGQFSIGHAGFLAIGAYTSGILTKTYGWPFALALPAAATLAALIGFLLGVPALRLSGPYLAVATLGFGVAIPQLVIWRGGLTGGSSGLQSLPQAALPIWYDGSTLYNVVLRSDRQYYYLVLAITALLILLARNVIHSHTGRAFGAIRDSELAAQAMGVNLLRYKTASFALSAFYAGIAGSLYAHLIRGIAPEDFTLFLSVEFLTMVVVGGLGSIWGAIFGAFFITSLPQIFIRLPVLGSQENRNLFIVVFGALLILTVIFLPQGIAGAFRGRGLRLPGRGQTVTPTETGTTAPAVDLEGVEEGSAEGRTAAPVRAPATRKSDW